MKFTGVIEGFYGRPWSLSQRKKLINQFTEFGGLNTYIYAPKDDFKHRQKWRELYSVTELQEISQIVEICKNNNVNFIYAIAPGIDISYSSSNDFNYLSLKLNQILRLGVEGAAILFDDIPEQFCDEDKKKYNSFAQAQAEISNKLMENINTDNWFFCPTVYCSDQTKGSLEKNDYLQELSNSLHVEFNLFWTGPNVVSPEINLVHVKELKSIFQNPIVIWDNIFANDYDLHRCFMGPFSGREEIKDEIAGILLNPNCEFELNFIPIKTFSDFCQGGREESYQNAQTEWYTQFEECISLDELQLLIEVFHLPHKFGKKGNEVVALLKSNKFDKLAQNSWDILQKLAYMENRKLFHSIYPYAWELYYLIKKCKEGTEIELLPQTRDGSLVFRLEKLKKS